MANPATVACAADQWTIVVTSGYSARVFVLGVGGSAPPSQWRYTYRVTGAPAPAVGDLGILAPLSDRDSATPSVRCGHGELVDIYVRPVGSAGQAIAFSPLDSDTESAAAVEAAINLATAQLVVINNSTGLVATAIGTHGEPTDDPGIRLLGKATAAAAVDVADGEDAGISTDLKGQTRLASHTVATTSDRVEEIDNLATQHYPYTLVDLTAVAVDPGLSYAPDAAGQPVADYKNWSVQLYLIGGVGAAAANRTVTVTVECTNGLQVAAVTQWEDITESVKDEGTGLDSYASFTATGAAAVSYFLSINDVGGQGLNAENFRVAYDWDGDPSVTPGAIVVRARGRAL